MKFFKNIMGFTLVEVMVALGISSALVVVIMTAQQQSISSGAALKTNVEVNELIQRLTAELSKVEVCTNNFGNNNAWGTGYNIPMVPGSPVSITHLKGANWAPTAPRNENYILSKGDKLGDWKNNGDHIVIDDITYSSGGLNKLKITVTFTPKISKKKDFVSGNVQNSFSILINVFANRNAPTVVESCFSDTQTALESAVINACKGNDVNLVPPSLPNYPYGRCERTIEVQNSSGTPQANPVCPNGELLKEMYSNATLKKKVFKCAKVPNLSCGTWQYLAGTDVNGAAICRSLLTVYGVNTTGIFSTKPGTYYVVSLTCPGGWVMTGVNPATNAANCINPNIQQNCPAGQYATGYDSSGNLTCTTYQNSNGCGAGYYASAIDSIGNVTCTIPTFGGGCGAGTVANGVDASGNVTCVAMPN